MSDSQFQSQITALERENQNLRFENIVLKAHLAKFMRCVANPEHEKRSTDRRKQAYSFVNERRSGFDRRQMVSGLQGPETVDHNPV